jgi:hypothetical protein
MNRASRLAVTLTAGALALGLTVGTITPATAAPAPGTTRTGNWLERQLTGGLVHNRQYDFDDYGLTADTGTALQAIGGHGKAVKRTRAALARNVDNWTTGGDFAPSDVYAGSTAKAVVFAQTVGANPRRFGGVNLVSRLNARVSSTPGIVGRIQDKSATDYANTLGQAYAVGGLANARSPKAPAALAFLLRQQCRTGFFRLYFSDPTASSQRCDRAAKADRAPDTDATAVAVLNLQSIDRPSRKVRASIARGLRWLQRAQRPNGSFGGGPTTESPNANSTGLAAWALGQGGKCGAARDAARWVAKLRLKNGAIAYDRAALRAAQADGITTETQDQWRRATSQAAPGLRYLNGCRRA